MSTAPLFEYFPLAGRGELSRLICAVGGVEIVDTFPGVSYKTSTGWFGSLPVVNHGTVSFCQSLAVHKYFAALSERWKVLTPQQVAVDNMFAAFLEDLVVGLFNLHAEPEKMPAVVDKFLPVVQQLLPEDGFVNGHDFPTTADLVSVIFTRAYMPTEFCLSKVKGYTWHDKYPKFKAHADRTAAHPDVRAYVEASRTLTRSPPGVVGVVVGSTLGHALTFQCLRPRAVQYEPLSGPALAPSSINSNTAIQMVYFPFAGRGELCRLLAAVGGVRLEVLPPPEDESHKKKFTGSLPQMKHGDFELTQSLAMESYITAIAPKFQGLTSQQRAIDDCYAATKEDIIQGTVPVLFGSTEEKKAKAKQELPALMDKFLSVLEEKAPERGFTHGLDFPTGADLSILLITSAELPFQKCYQAAGYEWQSKYPKIKALVERTQSTPEVSEYLSSSKSFGGSPF
jgi:glutathione S-transferase